jgi:hypothetical protein
MCTPDSWDHGSVTLLSPWITSIESYLAGVCAGNALTTDEELGDAATVAVAVAIDVSVSTPISVAETIAVAVAIAVVSRICAFCPSVAVVLVFVLVAEVLLAAGDSSDDGGGMFNVFGQSIR